jgi:hypothetical protein
MTRSTRLVLAAAALGAACSSSHAGEDGGARPGSDGATTTEDGAIPTRDGAVVPREDAGVDPTPDAGPIDRPDASTRTAHVGTPCETDEDCPGLFCSTAGSGFGYCSWICADGMPCPDDAVCATFGSPSFGYCMQRCDPGAMDCAVGYLCEPGIADAPVCYPGCGSDAECPMGTACGEGVSGVRSCFTPGSGVGDPCMRSEQCPEAGYCLDETSWGTPHGLCVTFCDLGTGAGCEGATTCVSWGFASGAGSCIPTCDDVRPCRDGWACVPTGAGTERACVARCENDDQCEPGHSCTFVTGRCG